jgi:hypothetical protein
MVDSQQILFLAGVGVLVVTYFRLKDLNRPIANLNPRGDLHKERFGDSSLKATGVRGPYWKNAQVTGSGIGQYGLPCHFLEVPGGARLKLYGDPSMWE